MRSLVRTSNRLLEPDRCRRVVIYRSELPTSLVQQVTKIRDRAFSAIGESHHLSAHKAIGSVFRHCLNFAPLTIKSMLYANEDARPKLGSRGFGGAGTSAPGISCVAGSSQAHSISWSTMTSFVLGPAATRRSFNMVRQYSSGQSWSTYSASVPPSLLFAGSLPSVLLRSIRDHRGVTRMGSLGTNHPVT